MSPYKALALTSLFKTAWGRGSDHHFSSYIHIYWNTFIKFHKGSDRISVYQTSSIIPQLFLIKAEEEETEEMTIHLFFLLVNQINMNKKMYKFVIFNVDNNNKKNTAQSSYADLNQK